MQRVTKVMNKCRIVCNGIPSGNNLRQLYSTDNTNKEPEKTELSGFAKSYEKYKNLDQLKSNQKTQTFEELIRFSKLVDMGNPSGKIVTGKIYHVNYNDLYIDFGWKFHCVCQKPAKNAEGYIRGAIVRLKIKELELSTKFLGSESDLTLNEADCILLGLVSTPFGSKAVKNHPENNVVHNS